MQDLCTARCRRPARHQGGGGGDGEEDRCLHQDHRQEKKHIGINRKDGPFTDRDLYITVYGSNGVVRAHGANLNMLTRNLMESQDLDGKEFVRARIELAKKNAPFWQEYKFTNPLSKKTEPKAMYCQPYEDVVVCGGVYIKQARQFQHGGMPPPSTPWSATGQRSAAPAAYPESAHWRSGSSIERGKRVRAVAVKRHSHLDF
nr:cache domain-containing protein [Massilia sp. DJPM01]